MSLFSLYVGQMMLFLLMMARVFHLPTVTDENRFSALVNQLQACHQALVAYADANPGVSGLIFAATIDAYLLPGFADPGLFTYLVTSPGTVTTYFTTPPRGGAVIAMRLQTIANYAVVAGTVTASQIIGRLGQTVTTPDQVPNGTIAVQTVVRNH